MQSISTPMLRLFPLTCLEMAATIEAVRARNKRKEEGYTYAMTRVES